MRSFTAITLAAIALSQVAVALPQDVAEGTVDASTQDSALYIGGGLGSRIGRYLRDNISVDGSGAIGGVGQGAFRSHHIPGLRGSINGNFGATGAGSLRDGLFRGDGDIGGGGSGRIGVGKGYNGADDYDAVDPLDYE
ncbi:hypothetical protein K493DRAFT_357618 [Basidiobolus meristosporus CBS 931.73]|uniref:Uncharacterized protein n=1 Tax=Basidiobolus meristosporus CBS 931.73 TaxID=1314790 RepID=A0A1Y1XVP1_9FUNG|nr:hypothetical protein K493DRAFT_357618 [Basidiobolus meristosporus CBS 931.73]|eukprot:ORX89832.1 hypothetical protein K493DRAFT_357618 [Basidiobolus meristosporus CBS 931.73]